jgi:hypothetical protein
MEQEDFIRFGTHADIIRRNGFPWIIPASGKNPAILRYPEYGLYPADRIEFASWLKLNPLCNISMVMSGRVVAVDIDVLDEDLVKELVALAIKWLGPVDFCRVGQPPKVMIFYRALDAIPTFAGAVIEIFCTAGSKQVLLFGRHPETGGEYEWTGLCSPLSHRFEQLSGVRASEVIAFREQALEIVAGSGYIRPRPSASGSSFGPSYSVAGIGDMMSEILREIGVANADPLTVAASYFERAPDGAKHYAMVAAVSALVLRGYSDRQIIEALIDSYRRRVHDDPGLRNLLVCPERVRRGMLRRGAVLPDSPVPRTELDSDQHVALSRLRRRLHDIFDEDHDLDEAAKQVERLIVRVRDPQVRAALAPSIVRFLAIDGWDDQVISNAVRFVQGRIDAGLVRWAQRFREGSAS